MATLQLGQLKVSWTALLALVYFTYLLVGAIIFQILEREAESNNRNYFQLEKLHFLANYTCLDGPALEKFVQVRGLLSCCLFHFTVNLEIGSLITYNQLLHLRVICFINECIKVLTLSRKLKTSDNLV